MLKCTLEMYLRWVVETGRGANIAHPHVAALPRPDPAWREALAPLPGELPDPSGRPECCAVAPDRRRRLQVSAPAVPSLATGPAPETSLACFNPIEAS